RHLRRVFQRVVRRRRAPDRVRPCGLKPARTPQGNDNGEDGGGVMPGLIRMSLDAPEEVRRFEQDSGQLELVNLDAAPVGRATFMPGWKWSEHVKPIAGTGSCQAAHTCYF